MTPEEELRYLRDKVIELEFKLNTDPVTGAGSRLGLEAYLERLKLQALRSGQVGRHAMLYLDGDGFKAINDTFGHAAGDEVIKHMAQTMMGKLRHRDGEIPDYLARLGGDEFVIILYNCPAKQALDRAMEVQTLLKTSCIFAGQEIRYSCTVGCAIYNTDEDWRAALDRADKSMYKAKQARREERAKVVDIKSRSDNR